MAGRESSFDISVYRGPLQSLLPMMQSTPLLFTADGYMTDGTTIDKPVTSASPSPQPPSTYQGGGRGGGTPVAADGSSAAIAPDSLNVTIGDPLKRKRGRPRKYGPGGIALSPLSPAASVPGSGMANTTTSASTVAAKKPKGRPLGSGKKQQMRALGSAGTGFTPHIITVVAGEDVSSKIMTFSEHGSHAICVLSANGAVSNVTLRQPASSGGIVTYEGRFEILSLSGSFLLSESGGRRSRTGGLSVSLAGPDGRVLGGGVAGLLLAASPVQVIVGSFLPDQGKESQQSNQIDPISSVEKLATAGAGAGVYGESSGFPGSSLTQSTSACHNSGRQGLTNISWKL